jgi:general secretion pathway protein D
MMMNQSYPSFKLARTVSTVGLSLLLLGYPAIIATAYDDNTVVIRGGVSLGLKSSTQTIPHLSLREAELKDVLYSLAKIGQFNLIVDEEVEGTLTVDLNNVSVEKAFEYILTVADLSYTKDGGTIIVTTRDGANERTLNRMVLKSLPVRYSNSQDLASVLNSTVFSVNRPGGNTQAVATADARTNSLLIMGNQSDIDLAQRALQELDFPLQHKTFLLKNAPAQDVATAIAQTLFGVSLSNANNGQGLNANNQNGLGATGGAGGAANNNAGVAGGGTVGTNNGTAAVGGTTGAVGGTTGAAGGTTGGVGGATGAVGGNAGTTGGVGGAAGGGADGSSGDTLSSGRGVQVFRGGSMTFITNAANNTMTLLGTAEQIALAENLIFDLDIRPPQVAVEVAMIQLTEGKTKSSSLGVNAATSLNLLLGEFGITNAVGAASIFWNRDGGNTNSSILSQLRANAQFDVLSGRILARPTVVAVSGTSSTVNLTREQFGGFNTTIIPGTTSSISRTPIIKTTGLTLTITPRVTNNGTVNLSIQPSNTGIAGSLSVDEGGGTINNLTLLSSSSLQIGNARVQDGETLILGGLIQETDTSGYSKTPVLGDIPLIGNLFRTGNNNNRNRTELLVLVTPHIIKEDGVPYFRQDWKDRAAYHPLVYTDNGIPAVSQEETRRNRYPSVGGSAAPVNTNYVPGGSAASPSTPVAPVRQYGGPSSKPSSGYSYGEASENSQSQQIDELYPTYSQVLK